MPPDLLILVLLGLFAASLWIPYIIGVNLHLPGDIDAFAGPHYPKVLPRWVQRADRAHMNLLEQGMPFAVLVLTGHLAGTTGAVTLWSGWAFLALRGIHAAGMTMGWLCAPGRPIVFTAGWLCCIAVAADAVF